MSRPIGVHRDVIIRWCEQGLIPGAVQFPNGRWRFPLRSVEHLLVTADAA